MTQRGHVLDSNSLDRNVQTDIILDHARRVPPSPLSDKSIQLFHRFAKCQVCRRAKRKVKKILAVPKAPYHQHHHAAKLQPYPSHIEIPNDDYPMFLSHVR